jgi:hypothetical protein
MKGSFLRGLSVSLTLHSFSVTFFALGSRLFFNPVANKHTPTQWCVCNTFDYDVCGDHLQTCQVKSEDSQVHDWVVYRLGDILGSVGHKVKIHKITPGTGKERGDLEIKDYVVLQKPQDQTDRLPPPRTQV